ncbi:ABC transporter permease [Mucilaginibacter sp. SP1R1]|uniref:ABC transporter permease n=1 Tax=Mucilaginibacter sp. SP1R1 TaxID=2723091 RepID=UPI001619E1E5|nr:ABC transporter permease [Mucilaginibacter sp. SP1R1]MBB6150177.1 putative ABC transport system permease protein [Mucilaginibacter sp. SP1R1]
MFKSYFKTALRSLLKNKTFSFINIIGLAIGTLCCLYIVLFVADQYSYDKHHRNATDIYRITTTLNNTGDKMKIATSSPPIAPALKSDFPEVVQYTRVVPTLGVSQHILRYKENSFYEKDAFLVDSTFFDVFTYYFTSGSPVNALAQPRSIVLMKSVADKLFGQEDPLNKVIEINDAWGKQNLKVTGVIDESMGKSHLHASMFITLSGYAEDIKNNNVWSGNNYANTYIKLQPNGSAAAFEKKLPAFIDKYAGQELKTRGMTKSIHLQPIATIHTTPGYEAEPGKTVSSSFLYVLILIAVLIQVIACINFMNLSTARASKRAKEVGVRKVMGAGKNSLIIQFLSESFLMTFIGVLIALPLLYLALPYLNHITEADIRFSFLSDYRLWLMLLATIFITGLVAGSYPAFYLSAFKAIKVLKGNFSNQVSAAGIRRSLVVFQFVLSIVLIAGVIVIFSQLNYIKNKDLGFDKNQKMVFTFLTTDSKAHMNAFVNHLHELPEIKSISKANNYFGRGGFHDWGVFLAGQNLAQSVDQRNMATDENYVPTMGIKLISGRNFRLNDSGRVLINEALVKRLGLTAAKALGTKLFTEGESYEIAGVMKDFNFQSMHENIGPFMLIYNPKADDIFNVIINTSSADYKNLLQKIGAIWHKDVPATPFEFAFMDDQIQKQYETEITLSNIINSFTLMAIVISCLGLFGLAAFSAEQRNKEIGIRKVLGASVAGIVQLLSKDFLKLVLVSIVIAVPIAYYAMDKWLQAFAYRIQLNWWMFASAGIIAILIAVFTVSFQAVKAALANPVKSLRTE